MKDAQPEQIEAGATVHLAFDQLESVNLPFDRTIAPGQTKNCLDGSLIAQKTIDEPSEGSASGGFQPTRPRGKIAGANNAEELSSDVCERGDLRRGAIEFLEIGMCRRCFLQHEDIGEFLTMQLGPDQVLLTAGTRFRRGLDVEQLEATIDRIKNRIRLEEPKVERIFIEPDLLEGFRPSSKPPKDPL